MENKKRQKFFIIGGDLRQLKCASYLKKKGFDTVLYGFSPDADDMAEISENPADDIKTADFILLPLPVTYDSVTINAPLSKEKIPLGIIYENIGENTQIFGGMINEEFKNCCISKNIHDYAKNEEFLVKNAAITVEGAFDIIFSETPISVFGSELLITGYGRIGKITANVASSLGAHVTVAARKTSDLSWIELNGFTPVKYKNLEYEIGKFDIIVNTVPYRIFDKKLISKIADGAFFIDLASLPGGCDMKDMQMFGVKAVHALSLPGKTAPYSSGKIISDTIINMIDKD